MIGNFGDFIFEVSDKKIFTFSKISLENKVRIAKHNIIGKPQLTEFLGVETGAISLEINLKKYQGVDPRKEYEKLIKTMEEGIVSPLIIGDMPIGENWIITSISQEWNKIFNNGVVISINGTIKLEEYL